MLPAIGSLTVLNSGGRLGVVVDARPPAEPVDGRQLAALQLRTVDQRDAQGQAAARVSGLAPLPAEATERPGASRRTFASRDERAAAALARLPQQRSELARISPGRSRTSPTIDPTAGRMRWAAPPRSGPRLPGSMPQS